MATSLDPGDLLRTRVWCAAGDQASVNTYYFLVAATSGGVTTDQNVADQLDAWFGPVYKPLIANTAQYRGVQVQIVKTPLRAAVQAFAEAGDGTGGAVGMPRQVAGLIKYLTPDAGRQYRGRAYIPFPSTSAGSGDGLPSSAYLVNLANLTALLASISTIDNSLSAPTGFITVVQSIVHSVPKGGTPPPPPPSPIINWQIAEVWATQRRRGSFGRPNLSPI